MCWKVPFLQTECSSGGRNEGKCWKRGIWVEAWSWKQASVLNCSTLEATWRRNGHIGCRVSGCLLAERVRYGMAGLEGEKTLTRAVLRARRTRWELPSQTLEASAWWNCSLGMFVLMCSTELPCWGWGGSIENLDDGHPFSGWQNNWHFDQNQSGWSSSGVTGPPLKSQLFRFETACSPFRKFWINELELGAHLSRSFFCMLGIQYLSVCVGRLQGVIQGIFFLI